MILDHQSLTTRWMLFHADPDVSLGMFFDCVYKVIRDSAKRMRPSILGMSKGVFTHVGFIENAWNYVPLQLRSVCFLLNELVHYAKGKFFHVLRCRFFAIVNYFSLFVHTLIYQIGFSISGRNSHFSLVSPSCETFT
jgi:hypothetical protein